MTELIVTRTMHERKQLMFEHSDAFVAFPGGVGTLDHLVAGVTEGHASAVLAASIFHFGRFSIAETKAALVDAGLPVRQLAAAR